MKILQPACVALWALLTLCVCGTASASGDHAASNAARGTVTFDENINFDNMLMWETPDVPYTRLLANSKSTPWQAGNLSYATQAKPKPAASAASQALTPVAAVPEPGMYSMLLVGLGLLALSVRGEKQDNFDRDK